jgi:hypothetical protein
MTIEPLGQIPHLQAQAVQYFWSCWGNENNRLFYEDCIKHSLSNDHSLPAFYVLLEGEEIQGSYALLTNDFHKPTRLNALVGLLACERVG